MPLCHDKSGFVTPIAEHLILCNFTSVSVLVGTNVGDIGLWDVGTKERLVARNFKVWELGKCSVALQVCPLQYVVQ